MPFSRHVIGSLFSVFWSFWKPRLLLKRPKLNTSIDQIWKTFVYPENNVNRTVENSGTIHMFCEEEKAHLLSKNMERTARIHIDR